MNYKTAENTWEVKFPLNEMEKIYNLSPNLIIRKKNQNSFSRIDGFKTYMK